MFINEGKKFVLIFDKVVEVEIVEEDIEQLKVG